MKTVDLVMFMGQSNMAGRGTASDAPVVPDGYGFEFKAMSDQTKLYPICEPFGAKEDNPSGIYEPDKKTGSLVSAFAIEYYELTNTPVIGVSASKGGSSINEWQPGSSFLNDAIARFHAAKEFLHKNEYHIRKQFMVWCQGETDGDQAMTGEEYKQKLHVMLETMYSYGMEHCFLIRIGNYRDDLERYKTIIKAQTEFCQEQKNAILVSAKFIELTSLMKDSYHYKQEAYNIIGKEAGKHTAEYLLKHNNR